MTHPSLPTGLICMSLHSHVCAHLLPHSHILSHTQPKLVFPSRVGPWRADSRPGPTGTGPTEPVLPPSPTRPPLPAQPARASAVWPLPACPGWPASDPQATFCSGQDFVLGSLPPQAPGPISPPVSPTLQEPALPTPRRPSPPPWALTMPPALQSRLSCPPPLRVSKAGLVSPPSVSQGAWAGLSHSCWGGTGW